uniref:Uncharacterized protein n=1 Tax=Knipowitschia caucasica TaxID=637954 RepID=A0AAV2M6A2_KNICA
MTADDPWDTSRRKSSSRQKDLMMVRRAMGPSWESVEETADRCIMCLCDALQRRVASKPRRGGLSDAYKANVTHSHQQRNEKSVKDQHFKTMCKAQ